MQHRLTRAFNVRTHEVGTWIQAQFIIKTSSSIRQLCMHVLRNVFNFWNVHGIMNTSGLLQSNFAKLMIP